MPGNEQLFHVKDRWRRCLLGVLCVGLFGRCVQSADAPGTVGDRTVSTQVDVADDEQNGSAPRVAAATSPGTEHPLKPAIRLAQTSLTKLEAIHDYETTFLKRERVDGRLVEHTMHMKLREKPFSVYLKFGVPYAGREILYVEGQNAGNLWAHEGSGLRALIGTVSLDPHGSEAMNENRYPIMTIGMRNMLGKVIEQWQLESDYGEIDVKFYPSAKLQGRPCHVAEASHPRPRRQFKFHRTRLYIDSESGLPIRVEQYGFPTASESDPPLDELYDYGNLRTNVGLKDSDFDRENPDYSF